MKRFHNSLLKKFSQLLSIVAIGGLLSSCDGLIYDDEGDCASRYKARFVFDRNMKYVDSFSGEVDEINLWLLDSTGSIVWSKTETITSLRENDNMMVLDVPAGTYEMVAWCKGENVSPTGPKGDFSFSGGASLENLSHLGCIIEHETGDDGMASSRQDLHRLYHGRISSFTFIDNKKQQIAEINLTKDTNVVRVMLQQSEGSEIEPEDFIFNIIDDNIVMDPFNNIVEGHPVTYSAWSVTGASATTKSEGAGVNCVIAELTTGRLMERDKTILHVTRKDGTTVLRIPLVKYALLVKGMYNKELSDQEYLDRKDEYNLTFFLDKGGKWISTVVMIESWRIVENEME